MSYQEFAYYYDSLMDPSFYDDYYQFINKVVSQFSSVLELGCGTGTIAIKLAKDGKKVYASDISGDMLDVALNKAYDNQVDISFSRVDMTDFMVDIPVDLILCLCDSINYLTTIEQIKNTFENVFNSLNKGGYFIFDINSQFKINNYLKNYHEIQEDEEYYFSWDCNVNNEFVEHDITIVDKVDGYRLNEKQIQNCFKEVVYEELLKKVGFLEIYKYSDFKEYDSNDERVIYLVKKG